jgi:hypothetical protein
MAHERRRLAAWIAPLLLAAGSAGAQQITPLLVEGDLAAEGATVDVLGFAATPTGGWTAQIRTDDPSPDQDQELLQTGGTRFLVEGEALAAPSGATLDSFGRLAMDAAGNVLQILYLSGTSGTSDDTGIYRNGSLLLRKGAVSGAPQFSAGTTYRGFFALRVNDPGDQVVVTAAVDDPAIPSSVDLAIVRLTLDGAGNLVSESVVAKEGDVLAGQSRAVASLGTAQAQLAVNDVGDVMFFADLVGDEATDGVIYRNGTIIAQEGGASADSGRFWENLAGRGFDLNNTGGWVIAADIDGDPVNDELIATDDSVFVREDDRVPGQAAFFRMKNFGPPGQPIYIDDAGNVLFFAQWGTPFVLTRGLFLNDQQIVRENSTSTPIGSVSRIATGTESFTLTDKGLWVMFRATVNDGRDALFSYRPGPGALAVPEVAALRPFLRGEPNPFDARVLVRYALDRESPVRLEAYDVTGRRVAVLDEGIRTPGEHGVTWTGRGAGGRRVAPGVYFLRLRTDGDDVHARVVKVE